MASPPGHHILQRWASPERGEPAKIGYGDYEQWWRDQGEQAAQTNVHTHLSHLTLLGPDLMFAVARLAQRTFMTALHVPPRGHDEPDPNVIEKPVGCAFPETVSKLNVAESPAEARPSREHVSLTSSEERE